MENTFKYRREQFDDTESIVLKITNIVKDAIGEFIDVGFILSPNSRPLNTKPSKNGEVFQGLTFYIGYKDEDTGSINDDTRTIETTFVSQTINLYKDPNISTKHVRVEFCVSVDSEKHNFFAESGERTTVCVTIWLYGFKSRRFVITDTIT